MKHYKTLLWVCVMMVFLVACREPQTPHIKIVCTSDVHGNLFAYDFLSGDSMDGSLARVSTYLKGLRQQDDNVIYIDNGDMLQGSPATYYYSTHAVGHRHVAAEALNYMMCDAVVFGNNEIELGGATYQRYADELTCPVLGGNVMYEGSETPFLPPYTIVERQGLKVAILGLTTPAIPHWIPKCQWPELEFVDMERSASRWMQHLRENQQADLVIGLFHSGYEGGIVDESYAENAARAVAERVPGFDAIFYGHDHQPRVAEVVNQRGDTVLLLNPGRDARQVATLDVTLSHDGKQMLKSSLVAMDGYAPDPAYMATFVPHMERITKYVDRVIGTSTTEVAIRDALFGTSALMDFIHQMQLDVSGAKISFAAPLTLDGKIPEGEIRVRDIFRLYPYENTLYVVWLTGREVKNYLEASYDRWINQMHSPEDHLLQLDMAQNELKNSFQHFDSAAGVIYEVDVTKPRGKRISIKHMADGDPFDMEARYMVAMNSYRALGGGQLMTEGAGITYECLQERIEYTTTADLRFYMLNYIEMRKSITPERLYHWRFVPQRWTLPAAERDRNLLFGEE